MQLCTEKKIDIGRQLRRDVKIMSTIETPCLHGAMRYSEYTCAPNGWQTMTKYIRVNVLSVDRVHKIIGAET